MNTYNKKFNYKPKTKILGEISEFNSIHLFISALKKYIKSDFGSGYFPKRIECVFQLE